MSALHCQQQRRWLERVACSKECRCEGAPAELYALHPVPGARCTVSRELCIVCIRQRVCLVLCPYHPVPPTAAAAATIDTYKEGDSLLSRYGLYPLVALGATALVSKEVLIISEETLIAINFTAFCTAAYIGAGDSMAKMFDAEREASVK